MKFTHGLSCSATKQLFSSVSQVIKGLSVLSCYRVRSASTPQPSCPRYSALHRRRSSCLAVRLQSTGKGAANMQDTLPSCLRKGGNSRSSRARSFSVSTALLQTFARFVFRSSTRSQQMQRTKTKRFSCEYGRCTAFPGFVVSFCLLSDASRRSSS